jgi:hypothetical protein
MIGFGAGPGLSTEAHPELLVGAGAFPPSTSAQAMAKALCPEVSSERL